MNINIEKPLFFCLNDETDFAQSLVKNLNLELSPIKIQKFMDGEIFCKPLVSVRNKQIFIIHTICNPINENLMKLFIALDAFKRAAPTEINVVLPYFAYARQDRKTEGRTSISAKLVSDLITTAGAERLLLIELHSEQIQGFFNIPIDHIRTVYSIADYFSTSNLIESLTIVAPDFGAIKRAKLLAELLKLPLSVIYKRRDVANESTSVHVFGEIKNKNCLIIDDMIDTGGTIIGAAKLLKEFGANDVYIYATHALLSGDALSKFQNAWSEKIIKKLFITDTLFTEKKEFIEVITVTKFLSEILKIYINQHGSVSKVYSQYAEKIKKNLQV